MALGRSLVCQHVWPQFPSLCDAATTAVAAGPLRHLGFAGGPKKVTEGAAQTGSNDTIRPFNVDFPEAELTELQRRINATRWPERETIHHRQHALGLHLPRPGRALDQRHRPLLLV